MGTGTDHSDHYGFASLLDSFGYDRFRVYLFFAVTIYLISQGQFRNKHCKGKNKPTIWDFQDGIEDFVMFLVVFIEVFYTFVRPFFAIIPAS